MKKAILSAAMMTAIACTAVAEQTITIDGSTTVGPIAKAFAEYFMAARPDVNITVSESGSGNGAKSLMNGVCDVANLSRPMKSTEFKAAAGNDIQPVAHVVALDGLPILVHPQNPIQDLTIDQIRKIYTGEITNWKEVGGPNLGIVVITRDTNSGTYETFEGLVMSKQKITEKAEYVGSNGAIRQRVQTTPAAIGYAGLGFVDKTVKALKVNGVYPSAATVRTGEYAIARPLFMYTNGYPKLGSAVYQFVTLYLTEDGQEMVEEIGFIPVTSY
ncbi:MAG: PstS family phosphate ABC transporter substrate-binding protein [Verrucomicrobia bacterium]|nr:PstS family phosphate ABC transporter substrate-binding protein [Verrucomicrobiota bacterium]